MDTHQQQFDFGMIGLGTMGRNLLLNMSDHDIRGAGYDKDASQIPLLEKEATKPNVKGFSDLKAFIQSIKQPRAIIMLVPAGNIVDDVIEELLPLLSKEDIIIDGGNSYFMDTKRREEYLRPKGLHFFGMGISGGEEGARFGPSMMPGGDKAAYAVMKPVLEAISAKVNNEPCVTYIGPGASGHFVKMVHNGIEYGLMQLISETYDYLKNLLKLTNDEIAEIFEKWNQGRLQSFLLEITTDIFRFKEEGMDHILLDDIKDEAKAKGTGKWTSQVAMDLEVPIPTIDTAVAMRDLSKLKSLRTAIASHSTTFAPIEANDLKEHLKEIEKAFYFSMVITYSQGMHLLSAASKAYEYDLNMAAIASIWRGGCIIRSAFLNDIYKAFTEEKDLPHLLLNKDIRSDINEADPGMRSVLKLAIEEGLAMPAYASSLSYYDMIQREHMASNLIQAQRDYFGAHRYERNNANGSFHTEWTGIKSD